MKNYLFKLKILLFLVALFFFSSTLFCQKIRRFDAAFIDSSNSENPYSFQDLSRGFVPTTYLKQGIPSNINIQNQSVRVITDLETLHQLYIQSTNFSNVALILIQIEDESNLNWTLNINSLNQFTNLKYLYFSFSFELCTAQNSNEFCIKEYINSHIDGEFSTPILIVYSSEVNE